MKCPNCHDDMHQGYLKANGKSIKWFFEAQGWFAKFLADGQHITNLWGKAPGFYCSKCSLLTLAEITLKLPKRPNQALE